MQFLSCRNGVESSDGFASVAKRMTDLWSGGLDCSEGDLHRWPRFEFALCNLGPLSCETNALILWKTFKNIASGLINQNKTRIHSFRQLQTGNIHSIEARVSIHSARKKNFKQFQSQRGRSIKQLKICLRRIWDWLCFLKVRDKCYTPLNVNSRIVNYKSCSKLAIKSRL